jgi:hypothetical protein
VAGNHWCVDASRSVPSGLFTPTRLPKLTKFDEIFNNHKANNDTNGGTNDVMVIHPGSAQREGQIG